MVKQSKNVLEMLLIEKFLTNIQSCGCYDKACYVHNQFIFYTMQVLFYLLDSDCGTFRKDIDMPERIQRRATKMIPELRYLSYEERLKM